jgi:alginate O-acetyltransferase complex protein AlgI
VIIADNLASFVDPIFAHANQLSTYDAWTGAVLYTFQIYFDFSAYSEMAVGLALLMNVRIPLNFNSPYKSISIIDFWRRWHISLSRFLRDYLYIPLGGNRRGGIRRYLNLFATMLLGGLWHGAAWTFVVWGGLHGIYLAINHAWRKTGVKLPRYFAWAITFFAVMMAWVFFRAQSLTDANALVRSMFGFDQASSLPSQIQATPIMLLLCVSMLIGWAIVAPNAQQIIISRQPKLRYSLIIPLMLVIGMLALGRNYSFIYFQF